MFIQFILTISRRAAASIVADMATDGSVRRADPDPLSHPRIARMTPAELADLPMGRMGAAPPSAADQRDARTVCAPIAGPADGRIMVCPQCA